MHATITLLGPPGCGKGTQAERLRDRCAFALLATGDLLREARDRRTELGRQAAEYMDRGELIPDHLIVGIVVDAIGTFADAPVALDGVPRTVAQAQSLDAVLREHSRELTAAVLIDVPDEVLVRRIAARGQGRSDDVPAVVRRRLRVYHGATEPLVRHFEERGLLRRVDGTQDPDAVHEAIRAVLG